MKKIIIIAILLVVTLGAGILVYSNNVTKPSTGNTGGSLDSLQSGNYPWSTNTDSLKSRLQVINLPALTQEGTVMHIHQHLDIYIDGQKVEVPAGIGINETQQFIAQVHTHDVSGIIHIESPVVKDFTLGQFFDIWGVKFSNQCLGGYCAGGGKELKVYINGKETSGNFSDIILTAHQEIAIVFGDPKDVPNPVPSSYNFPPNY